ncbi:hypothetical protein D3C78_848660 [compost metagenome]
MDGDLVRLVLAAQLLDALRQRVVVDALAGLGDALLQRHQHDARLVVGRHQLADLAGALDVDAHLLEALRRAVVVVGDHRAAVQAVLGHAGPAHRRRPQRLHVRAVDAGQQEHLVADLAHGVEVLVIEDAAFLGFHGDAQGVAHAGQLLAVLQEVGDVRVTGGDHLLECRVERQAERLVTQHQGGEQADDHDGQAVVEQQSLGEDPGALVELLEVADDRFVGEGLDVAHH